MGVCNRYYKFIENKYRALKIKLLIKIAKLGYLQIYLIFTKNNIVYVSCPEMSSCYINNFCPVLINKLNIVDIKSILNDVLNEFSHCIKVINGFA